MLNMMGSAGDTSAGGSAPGGSADNQGADVAEFFTPEIVALWSPDPDSASGSHAVLTVTSETFEAQPGSELAVNVKVAPKEDFRIRRVRVELVCLERYVFEGSISTAEDCVFDAVCMQDEDVCAARDRSEDMRLPLPQDALPTFSGKKAKRFYGGDFSGIAWKLRVTLYTHGKQKIRLVRDVTVIRPRSEEIALSNSRLVESRRKKAVLALFLSQSSLHSGSTLSGTLSAWILRTMNARDIRVSLIRSERLGESKGSYIVVRESLDSEKMLMEGQSLEWPFELSVGRVSAPSLRTRYLHVAWRVEGRVDIAKLPDPVVCCEVDVNI